MQNDGKSPLLQGSTIPVAPSENNVIVDSLDKDKKTGSTEELKWAPVRKHIDADDEAGGTEDENAGGTEDETELENDTFQKPTITIKYSLFIEI